MELKDRRFGAEFLARNGRIGNVAPTIYSRNGTDIDRSTVANERP